MLIIEYTDKRMEQGISEKPLNPILGYGSGYGSVTDLVTETILSQSQLLTMLKVRIACIHAGLIIHHPQS